MRRTTIARARLVAAGRFGGGGGFVPGVAALAAEYPTLEIVCAPRAGADDAIIGIDAWSSASDFAPFDRAVAQSTSSAIAICGAPSALAEVAGQVLTRWQRHIDRRNGASQTPLFDAVLSAHAALHDVSKPPAQADLDHALDTWQWMLRLDPQASLAAQLAALFHHARGRERAEEVLSGAGVDRVTSERARDIVALHERRARDADVDLVNDADGLSFLSLQSAGYADTFGPTQTRKKVAYTLRALGARARERLRAVRLRPDVRDHLREVETG